MNLQDFRYLDTNPAAFDCNDSNTYPNSFFGLEAIMLDIDSYEMSGTDCQVAYIIKGLNEVFKREMFAIKDIDALVYSYSDYFALDASQLDILLGRFDSDVRDAMPQCVTDYLFDKVNKGYVVLISPQMRFNFKPYTQAGADKLLSAMRDHVEGTEQYAAQHSDESERYYNIVLPSLYEDLGRVCLNCSTLAKESE